MRRGERSPTPSNRRPRKASAYPCEWIDKALNDLRAAKLTLREGLPDIAAFHAQQAAEKALKALLIAKGQRPPKTHDIDYLLSLIGDTIPREEDYSSLTYYAVEARYPGPPVVEEEAEYAIKLAEKPLNTIIKKLEGMGIKC